MQMIQLGVDWQYYLKKYNVGSGLELLPEDFQGPKRAFMKIGYPITCKNSYFTGFF